ncbi:ATP-binding protein [Larkinella ripae]
MPKIINSFFLNNEFKKSLNDIGANLTHPNVSQVGLKDIFLYPKIEQINYDEQNSKERVHYIFDSESVIDSLGNNINISIVGPENIGKSSLLKMIFYKLYTKALVPILIQGSKITQTGIEDFRRSAADEFLKQYHFDSSQYFYQLPKEKIVIIIDNFDKVKFNKKYKGRLLNSLKSYYDNIIISGNDLMSIEDFLTEDSADSVLMSSFKTYRIRPFGHLLRSRFINKWITLGNQEIISEEDRIRKLNESEAIINTVTGRNLVPNYPIFILTILQAIELGNPSDLTASTFGHYYQYLIQKAFGNILKTQHEITSYNNYLAELAFHLFDKKVKSQSIEEMNSFDKIYREKYTITHSIHTIIDNLCSAKILVEYDKNFEFKYSYIYYFFISKYLSDNIDNDNIKIMITSITKRIYQTEFANILLFLTHHSKHKFLLEEALRSSKDIFNELEVFKLEQNNKVFAKLLNSLPNRVYEARTVNEYRDEVNYNKDEDENDKDEGLVQTADLNDDVSKVDMISKLNLSFKMLEVLGQILKNNYGKISNQVLYSIVDESYFLGLRTLNIFFKSLEGNIDSLINQIVQILSEKNYDSKLKIEQAAKRILFVIVSEITYGFVKQISESSGTQDLERIYKEVLSKNDYNSVKLIDFSIKLDHFRNFPNSEMKKLHGDFLKIPLATDIMRRMVIDYLYLFPTTTDQKQRILNYLGIPMSFQRKIEFDSSKKK